MYRQDLGLIFSRNDRVLGQSEVSNFDVFFTMYFTLFIMQQIRNKQIEE